MESLPAAGALTVIDDTGVLIRIRARLPRLRPAEQRVAAAILADPERVAQTAITLLARQCSTSETTVLRFCHAIGIPKYPDLRLALARETGRAEAAHPDHEAMTADISRHDSLAEVVGKIAFADARAIEDTAQVLDIDALGRAVAAVVAGRRTDIVGIGASGFVGADLQQKLHRIGLTSFAWSDPHAALTSASLLGPSDVSIGISHTGTTVDTIEPIQAAAAAGATTVAITNMPGSPLAETADILLCTAARETTFRSGATASRIAQLAVIDCLFVGVAQRTYDSTMRALEKTRMAVQPRRLPARRTTE